MRGQVSLLAIVALPLAAGLLVSALGPAWRRWFGPERALALAGRLALGATVLAGLLLGTALYASSVRPEIATAQPIGWARVGFTTALDLDLELGGLAALVAGLGLLVALAVQIAALGDPRGGLAALGRSGLLLGATLLLALAGTVWGAALGWQITALVAGAAGRRGPGGHVVRDMSGGTGPEGHVVGGMSEGAGSEGHGVRDMSGGAGSEGQVAGDGAGAEADGPRGGDGARWARIGDAGVWLAVLATAVGVGDLGIAALTRGALLGVDSRLFAGSLGGPLAGASLASVAAAGLAVAVLARAHGLGAALRGEGPASRAALHGLAAGAGVLLLLRLHVLVALAPTMMAALTVVGAAYAAGAGVAGLRADDGAQALARVSQAQVGLMLAAVGLGAWVPACGLLLAHALASGALALASAADGRVGLAARWLAGLALAGLLPGALALWSGELLGAGYMYMSAWSPALNVVAAGLIAAALLAIAGATGHVLRDRSQGTGGAEVALGAGLLALAVVGVGALDVPGAQGGLRVWLTPEFAASWLLRGELALGPRPPFSVAMARWGVGAAMVLAGAGLWAAPRLRAWALRLPAPGLSLDGLRRRGRALVRALHELGEQRALRALFLRPAEVQAARAPGPEDPQGGLWLGLLGALAILGFVYCNPDVVQLGPSRVYPVDLGGLDPRLLGSARAPGREQEDAAPRDRAAVPEDREAVPEDRAAVPEDRGPGPGDRAGVPGDADGAVGPGDGGAGPGAGEAGP